MKLYLVIFFFSGWIAGNSQAVSPNRIGYVSDFPFFVETDIYFPDEITYYPNDVILIKLPIASSIVRMGVVSERITYSVIHRIDYRQKRNLPSLSEVKYKIEFRDTSKSKWEKIRMNDTRNSYKYLIDTSLNVGEVLRVSFNKSDGRIFQVVEIERKKIHPSIQLFRVIGNKDTTIKSLRTPIVNEKKYLEGFNELKTQMIQIWPDNFLELVFTNYSLNKDSSILYRLSTEHIKSPWRRTGHFALLRNLISNKTYILEVKYDGNDSVNKYEIRTLPYWYQSSFAIIGLLFIALLIIIGIIFIRIKLKLDSERRKKEQIQYKLRAVQSQLNPHFIFNALASIQSLVNNDNKQKANQYLNNFSAVLRGALKNSEVFFIPLAEELELLKNYLEIERLRFQFTYEFVIDKTLNLGEIDIPPMLFQPILENAIKHGVGNKGNAGIIEIKILNQNKGFSVCIFDNGRWNNKTFRKGYGISLTKERITAINEISKSRKIQYSTEVLEEGTIAYFKFINWFV